MDPNYDKLAAVLTGHSTKLLKGERVLIDAFDIPDAMVVALVRSARERGAVPFVNIQSARVSRELANGVVPDQYEAKATWELAQMETMDAYIAVRGADNIFEMSDLDPDKMKQIMRAMKPVLDHRVNKTKWVVLRWPTPAMAQQAMMSTESFEHFFFRVCTMDYSRMTAGMDALVELMNKTDRVELKGPNTDLRFSIKGIGANASGGGHNIPDGEVFSCPVIDSVEGSITYNTPTVYQGVSFDNIHLKFEKGRSFTLSLTIPSASTKFLIPTKAPALSGSSPSASTRIFLSPCATSSSMRRWPAPSTLRPGKPTRLPIMAIGRKSTGTWCRSSVPNTVVVRSGLTVSSSVRTASLLSRASIS